LRRCWRTMLRHPTKPDRYSSEFQNYRLIS
jgi:hypothetical protein